VSVKTLHQRCAGLDVHKQEVVACLRLVTQGRVHREVRRFPTTTRGLLELAAWLEAARCTIVAMEATGVYWKPVWHILDGSFELVLANAAHIKGVPGRKSDVNDATWIADLLAHGLIRASFVPPQPIQELRDLTRTRKQLSREIVRHTQRLQAVLEEANVKLASVITDILGASGRRILKAMITGETDPSHLAELGSRRLGCSRDTLVEALDGRVRDHHRFLLDQHLKTIEQLEETVAAFDARIEAALAPFRDTVERLTQVPGLSTRAAEVVIAEIGLDMSRFPTAGHLLSWAGLVPALDESAGKRRSTRVTKGAPWLKPVLVQCAWAAANKKNSYFEAQFLRLKGRRGPKKAAVAVAASILTTVYHMLRDGTCYQDLGPNHFIRRDPARTAHKLADRIRSLGYIVEIRSAA
jgi:transposase